MPSSPPRTRSPRSPSPTATTCSARWKSPRRWRGRASSRSPAARWRCARNEAEADQGARKNGNASASPIAGSIALLVKDGEGYRNLLSLTSAAFLEHADDSPTHVTWDELARHSAGLIALTGGPDGPIDRLLREGNTAAAKAQLKALKAIFGNRLYAEIQRHGTAEEKRVEPELVKLAYKLETAAGRDQPVLFPGGATISRRMTR